MRSKTLLNYRLRCPLAALGALAALAESGGSNP
jgi:hypothetical protein